MKSKVREALMDKELELELGPGSGAASTWLHWRLATDEDGVAWLLFDRKGASINSLSEEVITELDAVLGIIEGDQPKGLVVRSAKASGFIAGADISEFRGATDPALVQAAIGRANTVVDRLEALKVPTIAVIHGFCLGGGLEIALACKWRIAIDGAKFGFPEVMLGLHPGLGGTARSTHLIDPLQAMTLMLTGKTLDARKAKSLGLIDAVTQERHVRNAVKAAVSGKLKSRRLGLKSAILNTAPVRRFAAHRMRASAEEKAPHDQYPAPYALIDLWERHGGSRAEMMAVEKPSFARLAVTSTAQNLVRIFFLRDQMKQSAGERRDFRHIHVIGAGAMGGDIAAWCAFRGLRVTLADMKPEPIASALKRAADLYHKISRRSIEIRDALDRLIPDLKGDGLRKADIVIEAVPETRELKRKVYADIEPQLKHDAILATNTSSIPLEDLCSTLETSRTARRFAFFQSRVAHAARRSGEPRRREPRRSRRGAKLRRTDRSIATSGQKRTGLPREPCVDALYARGDVAARRGSTPRNHRWSRRAVRHADRSNRIGGSGRSRHLSCRCGNAESKARPADACGAGLAASKGRGGRAWP